MLFRAVFLALTCLAFFSTTAQAQPRSSLQKRVARTAPPQAAMDNRLAVDFAPLLTSGMGASYERTFFSNFTVGPNVSYFQLTNNEKGTIKNKVLTYGLHGRYFFTSPNRDSLYVLGGAVMADVKTEAQITGTSSGSASKSSFGPLAGLGYQWVASGMMTGSKTLFNLGATYGHGYEIETLAQSINYGATTVKSVDIRNSLFLEATAGILF